MTSPQPTDSAVTALAAILEEVLGFPPDAYFPPLSKSGAKPDFTPADPVAHRFVFDAKSSAIGDLDAHEGQIRRYIDQRGLRFGVLFNLRELRVYARRRRGDEPELSFPLLPLRLPDRGRRATTAPGAARRHRLGRLPGGGRAPGRRRRHRARAA